MVAYAPLTHVADCRNDAWLWTLDVQWLITFATFERLITRRFSG